MKSQWAVNSHFLRQTYGDKCFLYLQQRTSISITCDSKSSPFCARWFFPCFGGFPIARGVSLGATSSCSVLFSFGCSAVDWIWPPPRRLEVGGAGRLEWWTTHGISWAWRVVPPWQDLSANIFDILCGVQPYSHILTYYNWYTLWLGLTVRHGIDGP